MYSGVSWYTPEPPATSKEIELPEDTSPLIQAQPPEKRKEVAAGVKFAFEELSKNRRVFEKPIQTQQDALDAGLVDEFFAPTSAGRIAFGLMEAGVLDEKFQPTQKGVAYMASPEDLAKPENLELFKIVKRDGLMDVPDVPLGESVKEVASFVADAAKGTPETIALTAANVFLQANKKFWNSLGVELDASTKSTTDAVYADAALRDLVFREQTMKNLGNLSAGLGLITTTEGIGETEQQAKEDYTQRRLLAEQARLQARINAQLPVGQYNDVVGGFLAAGSGYGKYVAEQATQTFGEQEVAETVKETAALTEFLGPENLIPVGTAFKVAISPLSKLGTRASLAAERVMAKPAANAASLAETNASLVAARTSLDAASTTQASASRIADRLRNTFSSTGDQVLLDRAKQASAIADRAGARVLAATDEVAKLEANAAKLADDIAKSERFLSPETAAKTYNALTQGSKRLLTEKPANLAAGVLEATGNILTKTDTALADLSQRVGVAGVYNTLSSGIGIAGIAGTAAILGPVPAVIAGAKAVLNSGKILNNLGTTTRIVGREMAKARGSSNFWRRVANTPGISPAHRSLFHLMDHTKIASLYGGGKRVAGGMIAAYPSDLAFEYLYEGEMSEAAAKQALAETLVLGGSSAALGGLFMGSKKRYQQLASGDELNFIRQMDDQQKAVFMSAPQSFRRGVSTFATVFPNTEFQFVRNGGQGGYHSQGKVVIDLDSSNPLKPLVAHEVAHHVAYVNQMESGISALLVGDGEFGGILRAADGTLLPEFQSYAEEYKNRLKNQSEATGTPYFEPDISYLANEYFVDQVADDLFSAAESGELGAIAGRTAGGRVMRNALEGIMQRTPLIKNLHARFGGTFDQNGKVVFGNGLLAEGMAQNPQIKRMFDKLVRRSAGYAQGQFKSEGEAARARGEKGAGEIPINREDKPMVELVGPVLFQGTYENGVWQNKLDANGDPIPIPKATDDARSTAGVTVIEELNKQPDAPVQEGQMSLQPDGTVPAGWMPPFIVNALKKAGILNPAQIRIIENINNSIKKFSGNRFSVIYHPALARSKRGKLRYESLRATIRDVVPMGLQVTKVGNILVSLMSVNQLDANIDRMITSKRGRSLYQGNRNAFMQDIGAVMDRWNKGQSSDSYFQEKYGGQWEQRKNFVNLAFGLSTRKQTEVDPVTGRVPNPLFLEDNVRGNSVFRTYRVDRMSRATKMSGERPDMPVDYAAAIGNLMPNGLPTLDDNGRPIAERFYTGEEETPDTSLEDLNPVTNKQEAQRLWADGKQMFAVHEMDETLIPITSKAMLDSYSAEAIVWMEPGVAPAGEASNQARLMPEGRYDQETALRNKKILADRFEKFKPQIGVENLLYGWQRPSDGKFINTEQHHFFFRDDYGNQLGDPTSVGYLRIAREGNALFYEGRPNSKQLKELKDTAIENNLNLLDATPRSSRLMPDARFADLERRAKAGDKEPGGDPNVEVGGKIISEGTKDALPVMQAVDDSGELKFKDGKPVPIIIRYNLLKSPRITDYSGSGPVDATQPDFSALPYDVPKTAQKEINDAIASGAVDAAVKDVVSKTRRYLKNPEIRAGMGWYSRMREKLLNALGEKGRELFSQLLGATSARTPVRENFLQSIDALEGIENGRYETNRNLYIEMLDLESTGRLGSTIIERGYVGQIQSTYNQLIGKAKELTGADKKAALDAAKKLKDLISKNPENWKKSDRYQIMMIATDMIPKRSNGKKFNANSLAVLKVIHGSWLDNRNAPKTPNFAGNLSGRTLQATIDVWAARFLRSILYEGMGKPWRIQPKSESAVSNEDFALGQIIFERAAKKLKMNPDDLQAVLWFAEKDRWDKKGWTKKVGAEKSSFDDVFSIFFPEGGKRLTFQEVQQKKEFINQEQEESMDENE